MPRGDKSSYTDKQKRKAEHIEAGYEHRGVSHDEAERRHRVRRLEATDERQVDLITTAKQLDRKMLGTRRGRVGEQPQLVPAIAVAPESDAAAAADFSDGGCTVAVRIDHRRAAHR